MISVNRVTTPQTIFTKTCMKTMKRVKLHVISTPTARALRVLIIEFIAILTMMGVHA